MTRRLRAAVRVAAAALRRCPSATSRILMAAVTLAITVVFATGQPGRAQGVGPVGVDRAHVQRGGDVRRSRSRASGERRRGPRPITADDVLPIRSPELTPGRVAARAFERPRPMKRPVFVIGADRRSLAWVARYRAQLIDMGAIGRLVEAETVAELRAVARAARGLAVSPVPGGDLVRAFSLAHYPALITPEGIEQ